MLQLYIGDKNLSSWSLRPWLVMAHAGIAFEEVQLRFHAPDFKARAGAVAPTGRVPALVADGLALWESLAICELVAERHPEAHLWPADAAARAVARAVSHEMHAGFAALRGALPMNVCRRYPRRTRSDAVRADVTRIVALWADCRARFGASGPFLFGAFSIADAMFAPVATRFVTHDVEIPPAAHDYVELLLGLPAMQRWAAGARAEVEAGAQPEAPTPERVAVVFYSERTDDASYGAVAEEMARLAREQPGYLGVESVRDADGAGITVSYWETAEAARAWGAEPRHKKVQLQHARFYKRWHLATCRIVRETTYERTP